jgi:hypothetical protein
MMYNGDDGLFLFPVTETLSYVVRDNNECCKSMSRSNRPYDIFIITGRRPTQYNFSSSCFVSTADSYVAACTAVDFAIERVARMKQGEVTDDEGE